MSAVQFHRQRSWILFLERILNCKTVAVIFSGDVGFFSGAKKLNQADRGTENLRRAEIFRKLLERV